MPYPISRRTVLRGLGAAVALPWLEAMTPRSLAAGAIEPPRRMIFCYVPNGMHMPEWTPGEEGELGALPPILQPLDAYRSEMSVLSGLTLNGGRALGDGPGDHARAVASFLTSAHPYKWNQAEDVLQPGRLHCLARSHGHVHHNHHRREIADRQPFQTPRSAQRVVLFGWKLEGRRDRHGGSRRASRIAASFFLV